MRKIAVAVCLVALFFGACSNDDDPSIDDALPAPTSITVKPVETNGTYSFDLPATVNVDRLANIRLQNTGTEPHQAVFVQMGEGKTLAEVNAALLGQTQGPPPFSAVGGIAVVSPGGTEAITQALPAGQYAVVCFVPGADGAPHITKGMSKQIAVTGNSTTSLPLPDGENATAGGPAGSPTEYRFTLPTLAAGTTVLRLTNGGVQDHELQLARVAAGKTAADAQAWLTAPQGPPPMQEIGGPVVGPGSTGAVSLKLTKGAYVVFCRVPVQGDPKQTPHFAKGMFQGITIA